MLCFVLVTIWCSSLMSAVPIDALNVSSRGDVATSAGVLASQLIELLPAANLGPWLTRCEVYSGLFDYAAQLSDHKYDAIIAEELVQQAGTTSPFFEFMDIPSANLTTAGQACWALVVLQANDAINNAVSALPSSPVKLAQSVFEQIARKWDITTCGGGLNSTIVSSSVQSKDARSQITALQLAATLALRTDNGTYTTWAGNIFDWIMKVGLASAGWDVYTSTDPTTGCTSLDKTRWTANAGGLLYGSALIYNLTYAQSWVTRTTGILANINQTFFNPRGQVEEPECGTIDCSAEQHAYGAVLVQSLSKAADLAPFASKDIQAMLVKNGEAVAQDCSEAISNNKTCEVSQNRVAGQLLALNSIVSLLGVESDTLQQSSGNNFSTISSGPIASAKPTSPAASIGAGIRPIYVLLLSICLSLGAT